MTIQLREHGTRNRLRHLTRSRSSNLGSASRYTQALDGQRGRRRVVQAAASRDGCRHERCAPGSQVAVTSRYWRRIAVAGLSGSCRHT